MRKTQQSPDPVAEIREAMGSEGVDLHAMRERILSEIRGASDTEVRLRLNCLLATVDVCLGQRNIALGRLKSMLKNSIQNGYWTVMADAAGTLAIIHHDCKQFAERDEALARLAEAVENSGNDPALAADAAHVREQIDANPHPHAA